MTTEEANHITSQIEFVLRYAKRDVRSVLEVGPDNGHFLDLFSQKAGPTRCVFQEYNVGAARALVARGFEELKDNDNSKFDVVVLRHVFEHVVDPLLYLKNLAAQIDEGIIFIEVPDCSAVGARATDDFQFEHMSYFSIEAMVRLAQGAGLVIEAMEFVSTLGYSTTPNSVLRVVLKRVARSYGNMSDWQCRLDDTNEIFKTIEEFIGAKPTRRVAIYGAGTITTGLVAYAGDQINVSHIFDADPQKQETSFFGTVVSDPHAIDEAEFDVIVLTVVGYEDEVAQLLKSQGVPDHKIILLSTLRRKA